MTYAPESLRAQLGTSGDGLRARAQSEALGRGADCWEAQLAREVVEARDGVEARACANAALLDADLRLSPAVRIYAACARISVFGSLIGIAVLFMQGLGLTTAVLDVFSIGAAGVFVALTAGREAGRIVRERRAAVDAWVDRLMGARWQHQADQADSLPTV
jgi:hypothetical protein